MTNQSHSQGDEPAVPNITFHANFWEDVRVQAIDILKREGVKFDAEAEATPQSAGAALFSFAQKLIPAAPRAVRLSAELSAKLSALPPAIQRGVRLIETRSLAGESLEPHLSQRARNVIARDWLLNDWGIHHLHVHASRGPELLFVWVEDDALNLIDVRDHEAMAELELLEIILRNWPALLADCARPGLHGRRERERTSSKESSKELDEARRAGVQPLVTLSDGKIYGPRGGGLTTARGSSALAVMRANRLLKHARAREQQCRAQAKLIAEGLRASELRLRYDFEQDRAIELCSGETIRFVDQE